MAALPSMPSDAVQDRAKFWVSLIANVGFPIVVAGYLLLRITTTLDAINQTLARQQALLDVLGRTVEQLVRR
jgi:hypothetical protein